MAQPEPRTRLEQLVRGATLTVADFMAGYAAAAAEMGETATVSEPQARRWLRGGSSSPLPIARRVLQHWWKEPVDRLLGPPDHGTASAVPIVELSEEELIVKAGRDSMEHAIHAASALDPSALEQLHADARRAAHAYYVTPPSEMFTDLMRLRNVVYTQLDRIEKPRQKAELYLIAGQVCGLLSSVSWDLGYPDVAEEQARAAHTYGSVIDQLSLQAWARAHQVTCAFWSDQPRRAVRIAEAALATAPGGTARARLLSVQARALALIGARDEAANALDAASDELDRAGNDPLLDEVGGELGFDRSRRALCAGAVYVALGDGTRAEAEATAALDLFGQMPDEVTWGAGEQGARIDLGTARVLQGDLAGAEDALSSVFELEPDRRTEALVRRLTRLGGVIGAGRFRGAVESGTLGEAIEDFAERSLPRITPRQAINP
jgi:tetratricopeptide (TPR) repeat protein